MKQFFKYCLFFIIAAGLVFFSCKVKKDPPEVYNLRGKITKLSLDLIGIPYQYGGDDITGFDCSGFIVELLKSIGLMHHANDATAHDLAQFYHAKPFLSHKIETGDLIFWYNETKHIHTHVELAINSKLSIGASGGGSKTDSVQDAIAHNAYIKIRPIENRGDSRKLYYAKLPYNSERC